MARDTDIEWADDTLNFWIGCTKVSPGCDHCYAEAMNRRFKRVEWGPHAERVATSARTWEQAHRWNAAAARTGQRRVVFANSMSDFFDNAVPEAWRAAAWAVMRDTPHLTWLVLTKRPGNIIPMLPRDWGTGWRNVILGTSAENQVEADRRIPLLVAAPAARRFLSCEPLLGPVELWRDLGGGRWAGPGVDPRTGRPGVDWVIAGGESSAGARPMQPAWPRALRDQCAAAAVPFFFKQWGDWIVETEPAGAPAIMRRGGARTDGPATLDGRTHAEPARACA